MITLIARDGFSGSPGSPAEKVSASCLCPAGSEPAAAGKGIVAERTPIAATMVSLVIMSLLPFSNFPWPLFAGLMAGIPKVKITGQRPTAFQAPWVGGNLEAWCRTITEKGPKYPGGRRAQS